MRFDLASEWRLSCGRKGIPEIPVQLPGDNYSALLDSGLIPDPCIGLNENAVQWVHECDWIFAKEFELKPEFLASKVIFLNIDSIDTFGEVRINGEFAGRSENMFTRFRADVRKFLKPGLNRIEVLIKSPSRRAQEESRKQPFELVTLKFMNSVPHMNLIRKVQCHGGWDWGITLVGVGFPRVLRVCGTKGSACRFQRQQFHTSSGKSARADLCRGFDQRGTRTPFGNPRPARIL